MDSLQPILRVGQMVKPIESQIMKDTLHGCTFGHRLAYLADGGVACGRCGARLG